MPPGSVCRQAANLCDLPEMCSGYNGMCPPDLFVKNAVPCDGGRGYCFNGQCPSMDEQCSEIWGRKADRADPACFRQFNSGGTISGNCGKTRYGGQYKPCEPE